MKRLITLSLLLLVVASSGCVGEKAIGTFTFKTFQDGNIEVWMKDCTNTPVENTIEIYTNQYDCKEISIHTGQHGRGVVYITKEEWLENIIIERESSVTELFSDKCSWEEVAVINISMLGGDRLELEHILMGDYDRADITFLNNRTSSVFDNAMHIIDTTEDILQYRLVTQHGGGGLSIFNEGFKEGRTAYIENECVLKDRCPTTYAIIAVYGLICERSDY